MDLGRPGPHWMDLGRRPPAPAQA